MLYFESENVLKLYNLEARLIEKVKLDCDGAMGFIFCDEDPPLMRMASCERSRALRPVSFLGVRG